MGAVQRLQQRAREACSGAAGPVPSPCISVCRMDESVEYCVGCWRTLDEIAAWGSMDDEGKRRVWALIAQRARESEA
jgi:predicted Fe-S protein YdhL (DUF1289 family)